jgi:ankyrin repeat protein
MNPTGLRMTCHVHAFDASRVELRMNAAWKRVVGDGDVEGVRALLRAGADVDARDRHGQTALMLAAHDGHREVVEMLIAAGADLNVTAKYNLSALMLAIVAGHVPIARLLANAGADLRLRGSGAPGFSGRTAYDLAAARGMEELCAVLKTR